MPVVGRRIPQSQRKTPTHSTCEEELTVEEAKAMERMREKHGKNNWEDIVDENGKMRLQWAYRDITTLVEKVWREKVGEKVRKRVRENIRGREGPQVQEPQEERAEEIVLVEGQYEVQRIVSVRKGRKGPTPEYWVHWAGYTTEERTWETKERMDLSPNNTVMPDFLRRLAIVGWTEEELMEANEVRGDKKGPRTVKPLVQKNVMRERERRGRKEYAVEMDGYEGMRDWCWMSAELVHPPRLLEEWKEVQENKKKEEARKTAGTKSTRGKGRGNTGRRP